jgi:hypothetical protein
VICAGQRVSIAIDRIYSVALTRVWFFYPHRVRLTIMTALKAYVFILPRPEAEAIYKSISDAYGTWLRSLPRHVKSSPEYGEDGV